MSGRVTANSGEIGGYDISNTGLRKFTSDGGQKKLLKLSPTSGSDDMMSATLQNVQGSNMNVFEVTQGKFGTFPQQTIFGSFKSKHFDAADIRG